MPDHAALDKAPGPTKEKEKNHDLRATYREKNQGRLIVENGSVKEGSESNVEDATKQKESQAIFRRARARCQS